MNTSDQQSILRQIPAVDQLLLRPAIASWITNTSHEFVVFEIQQLLQEVRDAIRSGHSGASINVTPEHLEAVLAEKLQNRMQPNLRTVINATGVILHTNLGRAPLSEAAQRSLSAFSANYTNLEYDISSGQRSHRDKLIESLLQEVLSCEAATVVNNNAAAVFLILNTLALGREVIVSRGELVEIGGSFRIPDILARSGAVLREVGTTNKTRIHDYQNAIGLNTALLLRVHPSNYRMSGFIERPDLSALVALARSAEIPLIEDIGSGCLLDLKPYGIADEPLVQESISAGVNLTCFSGDKLLGGPQAGIIAGERKLVDPIRKNPLMRTYRVEKLIYGALETTINSYRLGKAALEVPIVRMISMTSEELRKRARSFSRRLRPRLAEGIRIQLLAGNSVVGGGSCPECRLPTTLIALESDTVRPNAIESRLRSQKPPIILRLEEDRVLIDLRTVFPSQESALIEGLKSAGGDKTSQDSDIQKAKRLVREIGD
jgi:L-seryl-tRNA(Ser) seleniumtransferase